MKSDMDPYLELGLAPDATAQEIRAAFRRAVRERHPDTATEALDPDAVRNAIAAYHLLSDPTWRARYDADRTIREASDVPETVRVRRRPEPARPLRPCPDCGGGGRIGSVVTCPDCRGSTGITDLSGRRARVLRCRTCRGRGRLRSMRRCLTCNGTGMW